MHRPREYVTAYWSDKFHIHPVHVGVALSGGVRVRLKVMRAESRTIRGGDVIDPFASSLVVCVACDSISTHDDAYPVGSARDPNWWKACAAVSNCEALIGP